MTDLRQCEVQCLGQLPYRDAWELQNQLAAQRHRDEVVDRLLLLEHPHTYTLGSSGHDENLLLTTDELQRRNIEVLRVDRGGDITYHGPGQLVGYPIIRLPRAEQTGLRADFVGYVRKLETVIIHALADFDLHAKTIRGLTGVWIDTPRGEEKIAAIGVKIDVHAVTRHGFALNINTDLSYFDGIIPCGIHEKGVTSVEALFGVPINMATVIDRISFHFGEVFQLSMLQLTPTP